MTDSKGNYGAAVADENRERMRAWAAQHPFGKQKDCARDLGLSLMAVSRNARIIRAETQKETSNG